MRVRQVWHARGSNEWHWFMLPATTPQEPGKKERTLATRLPKKRCMGCATWQHVKMVCKPACMAVGSGTAGRVWEVSYELHGGTMATRVWARLASDRPCTAGQMGMPPARSCQPTGAARVREATAAVLDAASISATRHIAVRHLRARRSLGGTTPTVVEWCWQHVRHNTVGHAHVQASGRSVSVPHGATGGWQPHPHCFGAAAVCF